MTWQWWQTSIWRENRWVRWLVWIMWASLVIAFFTWSAWT